MEDDRNRLDKNLKKEEWNLILEGIKEHNQNSVLLRPGQEIVQKELTELKNSLRSLSQIRHSLNRRLEDIKRDIELLQMRAATVSNIEERTSLDKSLLLLEDEGYTIQLQLSEIEDRLRKVRTEELVNP